MSDLFGLRTHRGGAGPSVTAPAPPLRHTTAVVLVTAGVVETPVLAQEGSRAVARVRNEGEAPIAVGVPGNAASGMRIYPGTEETFTSSGALAAVVWVPAAASNPPTPTVRPVPVHVIAEYLA